MMHYAKKELQHLSAAPLMETIPGRIILTGHCYLIAAPN
jgi:hypothetical protein